MSHPTTVFEAARQSLIKFLGKIHSRKLLVWVVATHMTYIGILASQSWLFISLALLGIQGGIDYKEMLTVIKPLTNPGPINDSNNPS